MKTPIIVWEYYEAPAELQISNNGGDEDWIAELPPEYHDWPPSWLNYLAARSEAAAWMSMSILLNRAGNCISAVMPNEKS